MRWRWPKIFISFEPVENLLTPLKLISAAFAFKPELYLLIDGTQTVDRYTLGKSSEVIKKEMMMSKYWKPLRSIWTILLVIGMLSIRFYPRRPTAGMKEVAR